jgi:hypothetical protein
MSGWLAITKDNRAELVEFYEARIRMARSERRREHWRYMIELMDRHIARQEARENQQ